MEILRPDQILTLVLFLGLLGLVWLAVKLNRSGLSRFAQGKRISVAEVAALGPQDRAMILRVDGREFLVLRLRGTAPVITDLGSVAEVTP